MFSRLSTSTLLLSLIFSSLLSTSHAAQIYRWVDDNGQPHYSENPPREIEAETLNIRATGTGSASTPSTSSASKSATKPKTSKKEEDNLTAEHSPEDKAKYCQQSRDLAQQMNANTQRRFEQPDGSFRKLEQSEIADYRTQAQSGIDRYCQ
ncbi:MAG: DUF4124 domain-containing protein [Oleispira sp.]